MFLKLALTCGVLAASACAADVPSDLNVDAFNARSMDKAVRRALDGKAETPTPRPERPFATEDLIKALAQMPQVKSQCAIPLLEVKGGNGQKMDPLSKPTPKGKFDAMAKPARIGPCHFNVSAAK